MAINTSPADAIKDFKRITKKADDGGPTIMMQGIPCGVSSDLNQEVTKQRAKSGEAVVVVCGSEEDMRANMARHGWTEDEFRPATCCDCGKKLLASKTQVPEGIDTICHQCMSDHSDRTVEGGDNDNEQSSFSA